MPTRARSLLKRRIPLSDLCRRVAGKPIENHDHDLAAFRAIETESETLHSDNPLTDAQLIRIASHLQ